MKRIITCTLLCGAIAAAVLFLWVGYEHFLPPSPMIIQGEAEATQISIASKIAGRIEDISVREGERVTRGQHLVTVASPELQARLRQARAAVKVARATQDKADHGTREEEIRAALHVWEKAQTARELARTTLDRIEQLYRDGVVPAQKRDEARAQWNSALKTEQAARATYDKALAGARQEDRDQAAALTEKAMAALAEVRSLLSETRLTSPIDGEITDIIADPGELIGPGSPVIRVVDRSRPWITFNLREDLLQTIRQGTILDATVPALGSDVVTLEVYHIAALGDFATWHATKASGDFDLKTFEVRARPLHRIEGLRPGMSVVVPLPQHHGRERRHIQ